LSTNVSIFGGAGFVGHALARRLVATDHRVTVVDNLSTKPASDLPPSETPYKFIKGDVRSFKEDDGGSEWHRVYGHLAENDWTIVWLPAVQGYSRSASDFGDNNVYPLFNLFEALQEFNAAERIKRIVIASSQAVYSPGRKLTEAHSPADPISVYGVSKLLQENAMFKLARMLGITVTSMRYSVIIGPGQSFDSLESGVLRNWTRSFKEGKGPEVYGDGLQLRDFVHIDDVTDANVKAINSEVYEDSIFNIGGFSCSVVDLAYIFQEASGSKDPVILGHCPRNDGGVHDFTSSYRHAQSKLGYEPSRGLGLQVSEAFQHFYSLNN